MMTDTVITDLAIDKSKWKRVQLGDVVVESREVVRDPVKEGIERVVGLEHIDSESVHLRRWDTLEQSTTFTKKFTKGQVLFGRRRAYLKKAALPTFDGICSGDITVLQAKPDLIPELLPFLINNDKFFDYAVKNSAGSLSPRAKFKDLANYEFLLPPKNQQARLAELLWAADETLSSANLLKEKNFALLRTLRESLFFFDRRSNNLAYNDRLKKQVSADITFTSLGSSLTDIRYGTPVKSNSVGIGLPVLGIPNIVKENLHTGDISYVELPQSELNNNLLSEGDILIVRTNGNPEYTGRSAIFNLNGDYTFASYLIKIAIEQSKYRPDFISRYLQTDTVRRYFRRNATSTAGNFNINTETIKNLPIPSVEIRIQNFIVDKLMQVEAAYEKSTLYEKNNRQVQKSLIDQIF